MNPLKKTIPYMLGLIFFFSMLASASTSSQHFILHEQIILNGVLYVGGLGPNNYTSIQMAIDDATPNDIIYIYDDSAPYYEHLTIPITLTIEGENPATTIINGQGIGDVISVYAEGVQIRDIMVTQSGPESMEDAGIELHSNNNTITTSIISENPGHSLGIYLNHSSNNVIHHNEIYDIGNEGIYVKNGLNNAIHNNNIYLCGHCAIVLDTAQQTTIYNNNLHDNFAAISLWPYTTNNEICYNTMCNGTLSGMGIWKNAQFNSVHHNHINGSDMWGILIKEADKNLITQNIFENCNTAIFLNNTKGAKIVQNNFFKNTLQAGFDNATFTLWWRNHWDDHTKLFLKRIDGTIDLPWATTITTEWKNFDIFPARTPYHIETGWNS
ncbi:MAG: right-handed parallel beta-helix repeat-containing protein [Candidatus Thermoplasmatota archaeon]|nr:right-handed parallel beta-helix repeat-containing protein [Candidatus Thermoplasmatota archaeon]